MPITTADQAVRALVELSASATPELAVTSGTADARSSRSLALDDDAQGFFGTAAVSIAAALFNADDIGPYDAVYRPGPGEFEWAPLSDFPQVGLAIDGLEPFSALGGFDPGDEDFKKDLRYATTVLRGDGRSAYLFRSFTKTHELTQKRRITLMLSGGRFRQPRERLFQFDPDADAVVVDQVLLVVHKIAFRRIFEAMAVVFEQAQASADAVHRQVPIKNFDAFKVAVGSDSNLADKVIAVTRRPYFAALTMEALEQTNDTFHIGVPIIVEDGRKQLEFRTGPGERWKLLKLLDDDYLTSTMTKSRYAVNSKRPS